MDVFVVDFKVIALIVYCVNVDTEYNFAWFKNTLLLHVHYMWVKKWFFEKSFLKGRVISTNLLNSKQNLGNIAP